MEFIAKVVCLLLIVNVGYAAYLHKKGRLVIYQDFTDGLATGVMPLVTILVILLASWLGLEKGAFYLGSVIFLAGTFLIAKSTSNSNGAFTSNFWIAFLAKMTMLIFFYVIVAMLLYRARVSQNGLNLRVDVEADVGSAAVAALGFVMLTSWLCLRPEFSPFGHFWDWIRGKTVDLYLPDSSVASAQKNTGLHEESWR